jgi:choline monooxygenase
MDSFFVDPDISVAKTLSTDFYTEARFLEASREKIFGKCWHFAGDTSGLKQPGAAMPFTLLDSFLGEPLLITRDEDKLHCLSNVCTHRGALLIDKPCTVRDLRCRYHGRRFKLDGSFASMPEFKEVKNFPSDTDNLTRLPLFTLGNLLFTSLDSHASSKPYFDDMLTRIQWLPLHEFVPRPEFTAHYEVKSHWALYCENYLEGFHIPFVHPSLNQVIDFANYTTEVFTYSNLQLGIAKEGEPVFDLPASSPDYGKRVGGYYFWVFPNLMFNFYPWGLSLNVVKPVAIDRTLVSFYTYVWDESKFNTGAGSNLNQVEMEDEAVVESVQQGIRSRFYQHGRYSVKQEKGTHHFHRLLADFMNRS